MATAQHTADTLSFRPGDTAICFCGDPQFSQNNGIMVRIVRKMEPGEIDDETSMDGVHWHVKTIGGKRLLRRTGETRRISNIAAHQSVLHKLVSAPAPSESTTRQRPRKRHAVHQGGQPSPVGATRRKEVTA